MIPPCAADPEYPPALERVVLRALAHDREQRFASTAEMLYELSAAVPLAHELEVGRYVQAVCGDSLSARRGSIAQALELARERDERQSSPLPLVSATQRPTSPAMLDVTAHATTTAPAPRTSCSIPSSSAGRARGAISGCSLRPARLLASLPRARCGCRRPRSARRLRLRRRPRPRRQRPRLSRCPS